ncbi:MAG: hypothetical protein ACON3Z_14535 [Bradymonadia bacterium]
MALKLFILNLILGSPGLLPADGQNPQQLNRGRIVWSQHAGQAQLITQANYPTQGQTPAERATYFLRTHRALTGGESLVLDKVTQSKRGSVVRYTQVHNRLSVLDRAATVSIDHTGAVTTFQTDCGPIDSVEPTRLTPADATERLVAFIAQKFTVTLDPAAVETPKLGLVAAGKIGVPVYEFHVSPLPTISHVKVRIDASTGEVVGLTNALTH